MIEIKNPKFEKSSSTYTQCPTQNLPEFAFIGRSNVGKSSLINMLCDRNSLAKTSSKPGKTQLINHFNIDDQWFLVDLPGYGYAKTSKKDKAEWKVMIDEYLLYRPNLCCTFLLIDSRHEPQKNDLAFMEWMTLSGIPFSIIFTKKDKLRGEAKTQNIPNYKEELLKYWEELPAIFETSSEKKQGKDEVLNYICSILQSLDD